MPTIKKEIIKTMIVKIVGDRNRENVPKLEKIDAGFVHCNLAKLTVYN